MKSWIRHTVFILIVLFLFLGVPFLIYGNASVIIASNDADAVSSASVELPEQPSGEFVALINTKNFTQTEQWRTFFSGGDAGVIMEDIRCLVINTDAAGIQLARRFQARLAENQMKIKKENGLLVSSKAECGLYDVIIASGEMAKVYALQTVYDDEGTELVTVRSE